MPAVVTSIAKPASAIVIRREVADVVVSLLRAGEVGESLSELYCLLLKTPRRNDVVG